MKHTKLLTLGVATAMLLMSGCDESTPTLTENTAVGIITQNDAAKAVFAMNMVTLNENVTNVASGNKNTQTTQASNQRVAFDSGELPCLVSGTTQTSGDVSQDSSSLIMVTKECKQFNQTTNGTVKTSGNVLGGKYEYELINLSVDNDKASSVANLKGSVKVSSNFKNITSILNGKIEYEEKDTTNSGYVKYSDFVTKVETDFTTTKLSYDGQMDATSSLYSCMNGKYVYTTIEALTTSKENAGEIESGKLNINGATFNFNNGEVTVSLADGKTYTLDQFAPPSCN